MRHHLTLHQIKKMSFEEQLQELARAMQHGRISLREYFELLEWGNLYVCLPLDGSWTRGPGYEIGGVHYGLLFSSAASAAQVGGGEYLPKRVRVRHMLERLPDGWGLIVDYGTDAEARISPDDLTAQNERIRIKRVRQEATNSWLAEMNETLKGQGIPRQMRAAAAKAAWADLNGFRVLPNSKRARRIDWYFDVAADATPADARDRCELVWRTEYAADPYLAHLEVQDLAKRLAAIRTNTLFADRECLPHERDEREWAELNAHVRFEFERRALPFSDSIPVAERSAAWPRLDKALRLIAEDAGPVGQLFKFGQIEHLEPLLLHGALRLFPASRYDDPSLQPSQRDDELKRTTIVDGAKLRLTHADKNGVARPVHATGRSEISATSASNYYLWCTTTTTDPRLFDDFKATACLVFYDADTFVERLLMAVESTLHNWVGCSTLVHYFDPVKPGDAVLSPREKDFRYAYQREYRFLWDPPFPSRATALPPIDLTLGNLEDVARLVRLQ